MTKAGAGTLILSASNAYTGGTSVTGGAIDMSASSNLGAETGSITLNGGTLVTSAAITSTRQINIGANGGTFDTHGNSSTFGNVTGTGTFTKQGGEVLAVNGVKVGTLTLNSGTVQIAGARSNTAKLSVVTSISFNGGNLDLGQNDLIVNYASATNAVANLNNVFTQLSNAYSGGSWQGGALTSSAAAAASSTEHRTALGYAEASTIGGLTTFDGVTTDAHMLLVRYTYVGDANLDGRVNALDFNAIAANYGLSGATALWVKGDANYDLNINSDDFTEMSKNFGLTILPGEPLGLGTLVPEPTSITLIAGAAGLAVTRRRRSRK
jgi:autotransporter-associated beta strand protein